MKLSDRRLSLLEKVVGEAMTLGELVFREKLARGTIQSIEVMAKSESRALKQGHRKLPASDLAVPPNRQQRIQKPTERYAEDRER